jgi:diphthine-ammonia ligase
MRTTALVSGGKDSIYAAYLADTQGWPVDELLTVRPSDPDSMMFHTPNLDLVALQAEAWGKAHREVRVPPGDPAAELEALEAALEGRRGPIVVGAIASSFQWSRLIRIGDRLGRRVYAPLWRKDPARVVREEIGAGLDIRFVHLAAESLTSELLETRLDSTVLSELERRSRSIRGLNVAGEGGEYETLVVDAPFFASRIEFDRTERVVAGSTSRLNVSSAHLLRKTQPGRSGSAA